MLLVLYLVHVSLGMFVYSFLRHFFILKNKEKMKKHGEHVFGLLVFFFHEKKTLNSDNKNSFRINNIDSFFY